MVLKSSIRLISYSQELVDGKPLYVSSNCLPVKALYYEPAGHSYHLAAQRLLGFFEKEDVEDDNQNVPNDKGQESIHSSGSYSSSKGKKKSGAGGDQQDHYALLGLGHLRYLATDDQIKKSYRETALKFHPDKQAALILSEVTEAAKQAKKDEIENHFKSIQEAYEALIDPVKRRIYDSTDEFDDEIPTDCAPQDFFKVYGPAFMRNGRWSVNQPVPPLGDDSSSIKDVDDFYDFWYAFKSWREFPHADEFDLEQAESRDHKRWMERQNAKLSEKARKEEYARVRILVDNAYKRDPRIVKRKEQMKAEKQRKKEAKYMAKKMQEEEAARVIEEERRKKEEEEKRAAEVALQMKKQKEKEKKLLRKEKARLRTLSGSVVSQHLLDLDEDDVEKICTSLDIEQLKILCNKIEGEEGLGRAELLRDALLCNNGEMQDGVKQPLQNGNATKVASKIPASNYEKKEKPWSKEEIELLRKGMQKFPKGTSRRWEVVSDYIGTERSVEEILKATKTVLLQKPDSSKAFDSFLEKRKPAVSIASPLTTREEVVGESFCNGVKESAVKTEDVEESSSKTESPQKSDDVDAANVNSSNSDQDAWSAVQERALVQALKTFPKETAQRWERVATAVPGKSVHQCKKKFASLKESFRSKKSAV